MPSKILVISTGGTIDSRINKDVISLGTPGGVIYEYCRVRGKSIENFDCMKAAAVQSENMLTSDLQQIVDFIFGLDTEPYSGIIVTHGTDTLAFTANLLGVIFSHIKIPMVITGSNLTADSEGTDAFDNIALSVDFINEGLPGVYIAFGGKVHIATRVGQSKHFTHDFMPLFGNPFAVYEGSQISFIKDLNPTMEQLKQQRPALFKTSPALARVMLITPYMGLDYDNILIDKSCCNAVLHGTYHTGSVNSSCGAFEAFAERCRKAGMPLFLGPVEKEKVYKGQEIIRGIKDVHIFSGMPLITAWAKLTAAAKVFDMQKLVSLMDRSIFFERV